MNNNLREFFNFGSIELNNDSERLDEELPLLNNFKDEENLKKNTKQSEKEEWNFIEVAKKQQALLQGKLDTLESKNTTLKKERSQNQTLIREKEKENNLLKEVVYGYREHKDRLESNLSFVTDSSYSSAAFAENVDIKSQELNSTQDKLKQLNKTLQDQNNEIHINDKTISLLKKCLLINTCGIVESVQQTVPSTNKLPSGQAITQSNSPKIPAQNQNNVNENKALPEDKQEIFSDNNIIKQEVKPTTGTAVNKHSRTDFNELGISSLNAILKLKEFTLLDLSHQTFNARSINDLVNALINNGFYITHINLSHCNRSFALSNFSPDEITRLKKWIEDEIGKDDNLNKKIQEVSLINRGWIKTEFEQYEIRQLKQFLNKKLENELSAKLLDSSNDIQNAILKLIEKGKYIRYLDISNNSIDDDMMQKIATSLAVNTSIELIDLSNNEITRNGIFDFADIIKKAKNTTLVYLKLQNNWIHAGETYLHEIRKRLVKSNSNRQIDITQNFARITREILSQGFFHTSLKIGNRFSCINKKDIITRDNWLVCLMAKKNIIEDHALIIIEGMKNTGQLFISRFELFLTKDTGKAKASAKESIDPVNIHELLDKYNHVDFKVERKKGKALILNIKEELGKEINYSKLGCSASGSDNCITWAIKQLNKAKIETEGIEISWINIPSKKIPDSRTETNTCLII